MAFTTSFARRLARPTGALELMEDLGGAAPGTLMLGGGNPARIPEVEALYARRLAEIAADAAQFGRFAASYSAPGGDLADMQKVGGRTGNRGGPEVLHELERAGRPREPLREVRRPCHASGTPGAAPVALR